MLWRLGRRAGPPPAHGSGGLAWCGGADGRQPHRPAPPLSAQDPGALCCPGLGGVTVRVQGSAAAAGPRRLSSVGWLGTWQTGRLCSARVPVRCGQAIKGSGSSRGEVTPGSAQGRWWVGVHVGGGNGVRGWAGRWVLLSSAGGSWGWAAARTPIQRRSHGGRGTLAMHKAEGCGWQPH